MKSIKCALGAVRSAVSKGGVVLLNVSNGNATITANNGSFQIATVCSHVGLKNGAYAVDGGIANFVHMLTDEITLQVTGSKMQVRTRNGRFTFGMLDPCAVPVMEEPKAAHSIECEELKKLLSSVSGAMAADDVRSYLNGCHLFSRDKHLVAEASNGHVLAMNKIAFNGEFNAIVPYKVVKELLRVIPNDGDTFIGSEEGKIIMKFDDVTLVASTLDGVFPETEKIVKATKGCGYLTLNGEQLLSGLELASFAVDSTGIQITAQANGIRLEAGTAEKTAMEDISAVVDGSINSVKFALSPSYLSAAVAACNECDEVAVGVSTDEASPVLVRPNSASSNLNWVIARLRI